MNVEIIASLENGRGPTNDGWNWLYSLFDRFAPVGSFARRIACRYFSPSRLEAAGSGCLYRCLGVPLFGKVIPTGGIVVRRATGARMVPYTLSGTSIRAARAFYYRACVFEALHLPFFLTLLALSIQRAMIGRLDLSLENMALNLIVNLYPMLHHRNTRRRIASLLSRPGRTHDGPSTTPTS